VFSFKPSPVASRVLQDAIERSALSQVSFIPAALGSAAGVISLHLPNPPHLQSPSVLPTDLAFRPIDGREHHL
jgi:hypothetical protein